MTKIFPDDVKDLLISIFELHVIYQDSSQGYNLNLNIKIEDYFNRFLILEIIPEFFKAWTIYGSCRVYELIIKHLNNHQSSKVSK